MWVWTNVCIMYTSLKVKLKVAQSCPTLCDAVVYTVHGILQASILKWVAVPFSRGFSQPRDQTQVSRIAGDSLPAEPPGKPIYITGHVYITKVSSGFSVVRNSPSNAGDAHSIPGSGRYSGEGNGNPLQYSFLGNPMDRGAWRATVHGVARVGHDLATERQQKHNITYSASVIGSWRWDTVPAFHELTV